MSETKCEKCGKELKWKGTIANGRMECTDCDGRIVISMDLAEGAGWTGCTYIVPDEFYDSEWAEKMRQNGWRVVRQSEMYKSLELVFEGEIGTWDGVTIITDGLDDFHGD